MDEIVDQLVEQQAELSALIAPLDEAGFDRPAPACPGWTAGDVVLHLAQTNEMAIGSAGGRFNEALVELTAGVAAAEGVDDGAALMVSHQRGLPIAELRDRWQQSADTLVVALRQCDPSTRVDWVAGQLSARTLATTRLAETWIHTGDVAGALGLSRPATDRLRPIARLAWRTLPYAFSMAGRELAGPVAFELRGPSGDAWSFRPPEPAVTTIRGEAAELCAVAARRAQPEATGLQGEGPDTDAILALIRTYA